MGSGMVAAALVTIGAGVAGCGWSAGRVHAEPPPTPVDFANYSPVNPDDYATYHTYGSEAVQFATHSGIRCRIMDGPKSFQYSAGISCWNALPGVDPNVNEALISPYGLDKVTQMEYSSARAPIPPDRLVYALLRHTDLTDVEKYYELDKGMLPTDPASYPLLAAGQKITIPGARGGAPDIKDAVCAAGPGDQLSCELQHLDVDGSTHGFILSPDGSRAY
jgi:hypothetical protein